MNALTANKARNVNLSQNRQGWEGEESGQKLHRVFV